MKKILREPFFHFVFIGMILFVIYGLVHTNSNNKDTIVINNFDLIGIISSFKTQWKRAPTVKELDNLVDQKIKQEVFYQEALKMKLDRNDEIVKRRLSQKMQFLSNDIAALIRPTDDELKKYFKKHSKNYLTPAIYSLYQITLSPDERKDNYKDAEEILKKYKNATFTQMKNKGDRFPFPYFYDNVGADKLGFQLGSEFSKSLEKQEMNKWVGPIHSGFGYHLVYITNKKEPYIPKFEVVKTDVIRDYNYDRQKETNKSVYRELRKNYTVELDIQSKDFDPKLVKALKTKFNK